MKSRAWFRAGKWHCALGGASGSGDTPEEAYLSWLRQITFKRKLHDVPQLPKLD